MVAEQRQRLGLSWYLAANYYLPKGIVYCLHLPLPYFTKMHLLFVHLNSKHPHIEDKHPHIPDPSWRLWTSLFLSQRLLSPPTKSFQPSHSIMMPCLRIMMNLYINSSYNEIEEGVAGYYYYFFHPTTKRCGSPCAPSGSVVYW